MNTLYRSWLRGVTVAAALTATLTSLSAASEPPMGPVRRAKAGEFQFSFLPKAFQKNPDLEMTVNTTLTAYGRMLRTPTPENPMYYMTFSMGYKPMGENFANERQPPGEVLERALRKSLAANGYLPAEVPAHPVNLMIIYYWGSHYRMDYDQERMFPELAARHRMERAMLVGGKQQLEKMTRTMEWGESITDRSPEYEYLRDQAIDDLYYVVASAYDYPALTKNERRLIWRTTMTVSARGVSMDETLVPLINTAAPYFGHEMEDPAIAMRKIDRNGSVIVGEPKVIDDAVPPPKPQKK